MSTFNERFIFFSTNPRSPLKVQLVLKVIRDFHLQGKPYTKKLQAEFYKDYTTASPDKGGQSKLPEFSGRQLLTRAPQALGFIRARTRYNLEITKAGEAFLDDDLFEDTLLHQMLKFQLPSPLHHERKGKNKGMFKIKPFLEITRLINTLKYLTYEELTIYGMTLIDYRNFSKTVAAIKGYRVRRKAIKDSKGESLDDFYKKEKLRVFKQIYHDQLIKGDFKTRESVTSTAQEYMNKKTRNWNDYTDAIFRVLHESGLFVATDYRTIRVSPQRQAEVDYILKNVPREPLPEDTPRESFDDYMFNPKIPKLLHDNRKNIIHYLEKLGVKYDTDSSLEVLKKQAHIYLVKKREEVIKGITKQLKQRKVSDITNILDIYDSIKKKKIQDAPTMMEWNTWRAVTMIDNGDIRGNFVTDDQGAPRHTAGGGQGDIVGKYGKFNIVYEVTLSTGNTQYKMESESVARHVGGLKKSSNIPTYGMFIAPKLNPEVVHYYYITSLVGAEPYSGATSVIPLSLDDFITFFKKASENVLSENDLKEICEYAKQKAKKILYSDEKDKSKLWYKKVLQHITIVSKY